MAPVISIRTLQGATLRTLVDVLKELVDCVSFEFRADGLHIQTQDLSGITYAFCHIHGLETYQLRSFNQEPIVLNVSLVAISKVLKGLTSGKQLAISYDPEDADHLSVSVEDPERRKVTTARVILAENDFNPVRYQDGDYSFVCTLHAADFTRMLKEAALFGSTFAWRPRRGKTSSSSSQPASTVSLGTRCTARRT